MSALIQSAEWRALQAHANGFSQDTLQLFAQDPRRAADFSAEVAGLFLDYSKQRVTRETLQLLLRLAERQRLGQWIHRLFAGEPINHTERRPAMHMALRAPTGATMLARGENVVPAVQAVLGRMCDFAERVRSGLWLGATGKPIRDVVNIGIGGSDLGPRMVCDALCADADGPRLHFVSNVDGAQITTLFDSLDPDATLWIVTSKTFTTQETMANAQAARQWFLRTGTEAGIARHFVAVSTNCDEVRKFGIAADSMFEFWDWVGGRYSLWSAVGLSIILSLGPQRFRELLAGAHAMDRHFQEAPLSANLPVLMGLLGVWNNNFLGCASHNIAPYSQRLASFTGWLQQLEMESNGKSVDREGEPVDYRTTPALWGDVGTSGQHAFFQMLHQGPSVHSMDFLLAIEAGHDLAEQHRMLIANCLAQSQALMVGKSAGQVRAELLARGLQGAELEAAITPRVFKGNRPSNTLLLQRLDASHLGALLALYEHRTFVQSVIWNINPFDQWGVELGKQLATNLYRGMGGEKVSMDPSTEQLIARFRRGL